MVQVFFDILNHSFFVRSGSSTRPRIIMPHLWCWNAIKPHNTYLIPQLLFCCATHGLQNRASNGIFRPRKRSHVYSILNDDEHSTPYGVAPFIQRLCYNNVIPPGFIYLIENWKWKIENVRDRCGMWDGPEEMHSMLLARICNACVV